MQTHRHHTMGTRTAIKQSHHVSVPPALLAAPRPTKTHEILMGDGHTAFCIVCHRDLWDCLCWTIPDDKFNRMLELGIQSSRQIGLRGKVLTSMRRGRRIINSDYCPECGALDGPAHSSRYRDDEQCPVCGIWMADPDSPSYEDYQAWEREW